MQEQVYLVRVKDDHSLTDCGMFPSLTKALQVGEEITETQDLDFSYEVWSADGFRLAQIHPGRSGYRMWAIRNGRISSLDDRYDHDIDEVLSR